MPQITELIRQEFKQLSPSEKKVANFIVDHLADLATYNSVELSRQCQTSKATISRLFKRLGYANFKEAREELRQLRLSGIPVPSSEFHNGGGLLERHFASELNNLHSLTALIDPDVFDEITKGLANARRVAVIGFRNSYPIALHFRQQLLQIRSSVNILPQPGQTLAEDLADLTHQDMVVLMAFHRRPKGLKAILQSLIKQNVPILLIIEPQSGLEKSKPKWLLELPLDTISAFDSYALPMSLVSLLSNLLLHYQLDKGRARIEHINQLYDLTEELDINLSY